eukprot:Protomagalhaensia_wolfi_Nauph_80__2386@NODE_256_length_3046_cov_26_802793_g191_i0_p3_GENE_NODE_256_length_3046_cov_26_802793_g191_i0NODE_256_length_3046_cov_26_802793_g191_i0_p3_ORF_typecomplete_len171_score19_57_NODE_256_length_3046_cov_26_802793_g191_i08961408
MSTSHNVVCPEVLTPSTMQFIRQCTVAKTIHSSRELIQYSSVLYDPVLRPMASECAQLKLDPVTGLETLCFNNTPDVAVRALATVKALQYQSSVPYQSESMTDNAKATEEVTDVLRRLNTFQPNAVFGDVTKGEIIKSGKIPVMDAIWNRHELDALQRWIETVSDLWRTT